MPYDLVQQYLGDGPEVRALFRNQRHFWCSPETSNALKISVHRLIDKYLANRELLTSELECDAVESQLRATFTQLVGTAGDSGTPHRRRLAFRRAIEYAESRSGLLTIPELAAAAGVSQRALELAFHEILGIPPLRYVRWSRLNLAYRDLRSADPTAARVTDIAMRLGFYDLGRFASAYKQLLQESPSTILARKPYRPQKRLVDTLRERTGRRVIGSTS